MNGERPRTGAPASASGAKWTDGLSLRLEMPVITFELLGYGLLAAAGLFVRLFPSDVLHEPSDAVRASAALAAARGIDVPAAEIIGTRALFVAEQIAFRLLPDGVTTARLVPALCGVAIVLVLRRFAGEIGQVGAIVAASFVALGPLWIEQGRGVTDASIASLTILLLADAVISRRGLAAAMLGAVAITALGWTVMPIAAAAGSFALAGVIRRSAPQGGSASTSLWSDAREQRNAAIGFGLTLVLITTAFMTRPSDLMAAPGGGMTAWIEGLGSTGGAFGGFIVPLLVYAPVGLVFGIPGLIMLSRRGRFFGLWLSVWAVMGCILGLLTGSVAAVTEILVPLTIGAGFAVARLLSSFWSAARWTEEGVMIGLVLIVSGYGLVHALRYADTGLVAGPDVSDPLRLVLGSIGMLALLAVALIILWGPAMAIRVMGAGALLILGSLTISNGFWLNYGDSAELIRPDRIENGAERLAADLKALSSAREGDPQSMSVGADAELRDILDWSLRDRDNVIWSADAAVGSADVLVLAGGRSPRTADQASENSAVDENKWMGREYVVASRWKPSFLDLQGFLRWYLQRRVAEGVAGALLADPPVALSVTSYVLSD